MALGKTGPLEPGDVIGDLVGVLTSTVTFGNDGALVYTTATDIDIILWDLPTIGGTPRVIWDESADTFASNLSFAVASDTAGFLVGAGFDARFWYDGPNLNAVITTDLVAPSDLVIDCGAAKTLELTTAVFEDTNLGAAKLSKPASSAPSDDSFRDEAGADTGIETSSFSVGDKLHGTFELGHKYQEGTDIAFHVHWQGYAAPSGTDFVKWQLAYTITRDGETIDAIRTIVAADVAVVQYEQGRSDFTAISGTTGGPNGGGIQIEDQIIFTFTRIAADGAAYSGGALLVTVGAHIKQDTMGSRQVDAK